VLLVQTVAGPLAGDRTAIDVEVAPGASLELGMNAATLAYPAGPGARSVLRARVGRDGRFIWAPAPLILAAGCDLESLVELELETGAAAFTRESVVLGRHGERPGRYRSVLRCELGGVPLLHDGVALDPDGVARSSRSVLRGARAYASLAVLGVEPGGPPAGGELDLAGPGRVLRALADGTAALAAETGPVEDGYRRALAGA
jgi:urease accessory protein